MKGLKIARKLSVYATTALVSILTFATAVFQIGGAIAYENAPLITEALGQDYSSVIEIDQGADAKDTQYYKTKFKTVEECRENRDFLEFLYNHILPNEMEQYLSMYNIKEKIVVNGYADQSGLMSAT